LSSRSCRLVNSVCVSLRCAVRSFAGSSPGCRARGIRHRRGCIRRRCSRPTSSRARRAAGAAAVRGRTPGRGRAASGSSLSSLRSRSLRVLDGDREVTAQHLEVGAVLLMEAVRLFALDAQHPDQLIAQEQRDAELALRMGEPGSGIRRSFGQSPPLLRPLGDRVRIERLAEHAGDANRLPRLRYHADDALAISTSEPTPPRDSRGSRWLPGGPGTRPAGGSSSGGIRRCFSTVSRWHRAGNRAWAPAGSGPRAPGAPSS